MSPKLSFYFPLLILSILYAVLGREGNKMINDFFLSFLAAVVELRIEGIMMGVEDCKAFYITDLISLYLFPLNVFKR